MSVIWYHNMPYLISVLIQWRDLSKTVCYQLSDLEVVTNTIRNQDICTNTIQEQIISINTI